MFPEHIMKLAKSYYESGSLDDLDKLDDAVYEYQMENGIETDTYDLIDKILNLL